MPRPEQGDRQQDEPPALRTRGLTKVYGRTVALRGLDLDVRAGEVFGLLGPNGAGKTTTVKVLCGLIRPTAGQAQLFGLPSTDPAARARLGYLPELFRFPDWMTATGVLHLHAALIGLRGPTRDDEVRRVLDRVGLSARAGDRVRGYSKGMAQRLGLAQAMLGQPALLLLDEPTSALDPVGRREVREIIRSLREEGVAVLLNSHLLTEVEQVCDRVAVVDRGRSVYEGRLADLTDTAPYLRVGVDRVDSALVDLLRRLGAVSEVSDTSVLLRVDDLDVAGSVAAGVVAGGWRLLSLVPVQRSLEEAFLALVEGGDR